MEVVFQAMSPISPLDIALKSGESIDSINSGRLQIIQSVDGYRFSVDALLLAEFVTIKPGDTVVDLGTGCGIIPLLLLEKKAPRYVHGLEIQSELASQSKRNVALNEYRDRAAVILGDIRQAPLKPASADVVVCNPPYQEKEGGRINPDSQRAIARHEMLATLDDILDTARRLLRVAGRFAMIYPVGRIVDVLVKMRGFALEPKRMEFVYLGPRSEGKRVLIEAYLRGGKGLKLLPPRFESGSPTTSCPI
jgi:tRNA1Val (adenine37-N6)-methyltransferase